MAKTGSTVSFAAVTFAVGTAPHTLFGARGTLVP